jgi:transcription elongation GreA/GreB family factor
MAHVDKREALAELRRVLQSELERGRGRAVDAAEAATHEDNRAEGDKDMRATESSYIARGHAERVRKIEEALLRLATMPVRDFGAHDLIQASALVELEYEGRRSHYLLVPAAGGEKLRVAEVQVQTLATSSPLGSALLGLSEGDDAEVTTPQGTRSYEIVSVR